MEGNGKNTVIGVLNMINMYIWLGFKLIIKVQNVQKHGSSNDHDASEIWDLSLIWGILAKKQGKIENFS